MINNIAKEKPTNKGNIRLLRLKAFQKLPNIRTFVLLNICVLKASF